MNRRYFIPLLLLCTAFNVAATKPRIQSGDAAEVSYDGLHRVDHARMDEVWAKPDVDWSQYRNIMLAETTVAFKDVNPRSNRLYRRTRHVTAFAISEKNKQQITTETQAAFNKELRKVKQFEVVSEAGDDVLLVNTSVIDVVSHVPPEEFGRTDVYLRSVGEATLVMEFRDSISQEILLRAVEKRRDDREVFWHRSNPVTNLSELRSMINSWSRFLRKRIDQLAELS